MCFVLVQSKLYSSSTAMMFKHFVGFLPLGSFSSLNLIENFVFSLNALASCTVRKESVFKNKSCRMAATATVSAGIRYAPEDPTLPKPWRGLVDGKTGYLYFWNPETNVTQYERPVSSSHVVSAPLHKPLSSSVLVQKSSQGQRRESSPIDDDDRYSRGGNGASMKVFSGVGSSQVFFFFNLLKA